MTPSVAPMRITRIVENTASSTVLPSRSPTRLATLRCSRNDSPRSPRNSPEIQSQYCTTGDRLSPSWSRIVAMSSAVESGPASTTATSPGASRGSANATIELANSTNNSEGALRIRNLVMVGP